MSSNRTTAWIKFGILLLMLAAFAAMKYYQNKPKPIPSAPRSEKTSQTSNTNQSNSKDHTNQSIPQKVYDVLQYIRINKEAPDTYVGGKVFSNREKRLPLTDQNKKKIKYQEWDVNPKVKGQNRGAERLITGSDSSAYYTSDHYRSFTKIN